MAVRALSPTLTLVASRGQRTAKLNLSMNCGGSLMCASLSELISCRITRIRWPRFERGFFGVTEVGKIALHPSARWRSLSAGFPRSSSPASADSLLSKGISASSGSFTCGAETQASLSWRVTKVPLRPMLHPRVVAAQHAHLAIGPCPVAARLALIQSALFQATHEAVRAEAYDLSSIRHWHAAIDESHGLTNLERVERADAARSTMRFGNEGNRPRA